MCSLLIRFVSSMIIRKIKTMFLHITALASQEGHLHSSQQFHCIANTVLALVGSCIAAFAADAVFDNNFDAVHIQVRGYTRKT